MNMLIDLFCQTQRRGKEPLSEKFQRISMPYFFSLKINQYTAALPALCTLLQRRITTQPCLDSRQAIEHSSNESNRIE